MGNLGGSGRGMGALPMILFILSVPIILLIVTAMPNSIDPGIKNVMLVSVVGFGALLGVSVLKR